MITLLLVKVPHKRHWMALLRIGLKSLKMRASYRVILLSEMQSQEVLFLCFTPKLINQKREGTVSAAGFHR